MNKLLVSMANLLSSYGDSTSTDYWGDSWAWLGKIVDFLNSVLPYVVIVVATVGVIYSIILGVNMAKAEDAGKREEAKKRIINFVLAIVITVVLVLLMYLVMENFNNWGIVNPPTVNPNA